MDKQQMLASIFFLLISSVMLYSVFHLEKALRLVKKIYGIFGIKLDFTEGGEKLIRGILIILCLIYITTSIALIFF